MSARWRNWRRSLGLTGANSPRVRGPDQSLSGAGCGVAWVRAVETLPVRDTPRRARGGRFRRRPRRVVLSGCQPGLPDAGRMGRLHLSARIRSGYRRRHRISRPDRGSCLSSPCRSAPPRSWAGACAWGRHVGGCGGCSPVAHHRPRWRRVLIRRRGLVPLGRCVRRDHGRHDRRCGRPHPSTRGTSSGVLARGSRGSNGAVLRSAITSRSPAARKRAADDAPRHPAGLLLRGEGGPQGRDDALCEIGGNIAAVTVEVGEVAAKAEGHDHVDIHVGAHGAALL